MKQEENNEANTTDFEHLKSWVDDFRNTQISVAQSRDLPIIAQTHRNRLRQALIDAIYSDFSALEPKLGILAFRAPSGVVLAVEHPTLASPPPYPDGTLPDTTGYLSILLNPEFKDLTYEGQDEEDAWKSRSKSS